MIFVHTLFVLMYFKKTLSFLSTSLPFLSFCHYLAIFVFLVANVSQPQFHFNITQLLCQLISLTIVALNAFSALLKTDVRFLCISQNKKPHFKMKYTPKAFNFWGVFHRIAVLMLFDLKLKKPDASLATTLDGILIPYAALHLTDMSASEHKHTKP